MTGHLLVVEYMLPDGSFHFISECVGSGKEDLPLGKTLELIEFGRAQTLAPILAEALSEYELVDGDDDEDYDDEDEDGDGE